MPTQRLSDRRFKKQNGQCSVAYPFLQKPFCLSKLPSPIHPAGPGSRYGALCPRYRSPLPRQRGRSLSRYWIRRRSPCCSLFRSLRCKKEFNFAKLKKKRIAFTQRNAKDCLSSWPGAESQLNAIFPLYLFKISSLVPFYHNFQLSILKEAVDRSQRN